MTTRLRTTAGPHPVALAVAVAPAGQADPTHPPATAMMMLHRITAGPHPADRAVAAGQADPPHPQATAMMTLHRITAGPPPADRAAAGRVGLREMTMIVAAHPSAALGAMTITDHRAVAAGTGTVMTTGQTQDLRRTIGERRSTPRLRWAPRFQAWPCPPH